MKSGLLTAVATLLTGAGLALAQAPPPPVPSLPSEREQPAPQPPPALEEAAPVPAPDRATAVDPLPWNPSIQDGTRWPYQEPHHRWLRGVCAELGEFWLSADYLLWAMRPGRLPPLVTTGPPGSAGLLGQPGTSVLIGDTHVRHGGFSGGRFAGGVWIDEDQVFGFEGSYFFLAEHSLTFNAASSGGPNSPVLARPFFNVLTNAEEVRTLALPGRQAGSITVTPTLSLQGAEATGVLGLYGGGPCRLEVLAGFRYLELAEELGIAEEVRSLADAQSAGAVVDRADQFDARNRFYAGQLGARSEFCRNGFLLALAGKLALGANDEVVDIAGGTRTTPPRGRATVRTGGLLALPTNSGHFRRSRFAAVPEVSLRLGYQVTEHLRVFAGYTFLYWSDVLRSGDQIDRGVDPTPIAPGRPFGPFTGPARPAFSFHETDFWAQGGTFGLELRY